MDRQHCAAAASEAIASKRRYARLCKSLGKSHNAALLTDGAERRAAAGISARVLGRRVGAPRSFGHVLVDDHLSERAIGRSALVGMGRLRAWSWRRIRVGHWRVGQTLQEDVRIRQQLDAGLRHNETHKAGCLGDVRERKGSVSEGWVVACSWCWHGRYRSEKMMSELQILRH